MRFWPDLVPYDGCSDARILGLAPLAVGWLVRGRPYPTGKTSSTFRQKLLAFCLEPHTVCASGSQPRCPLANCPGQAGLVQVEGHEIALGAGEIRVIGEADIYAAPTLIYHYVTVHGYRPPEEFVEAVTTGPQPGSPEHRALIRTLKGR